jgi:hypothetical protein
LYTALQAIPADKRTFAISLENSYLGDVAAIALCETIKSKPVILLFNNMQVLMVRPIIRTLGHHGCSPSKLFHHLRGGRIGKITNNTR